MMLAAVPEARSVLRTLDFAVAAGILAGPAR